MSALLAPIEVFYSYADADEVLRNELDKHLSILHRQGLISCWHDRQIVPGTNWAETINTHLERASLILLLISADFLASDYCYGTEMQRAIERHHEGDARVIPILLRPVDWQSAPFEKLQALPSNGMPITLWSNQDAAFVDIAKGMRDAIEHIRRLAAYTPLEAASLSETARNDLMVLETKSEAPHLPNASQFKADTLLAGFRRTNRSKGLDENFSLQWESWILETSKGLQPVLKQTIISATFILGYLFVIWLAGFAFADRGNAFLEWMYQGIKIFSVIVIPVHYVASCIIEMYKTKAIVTSTFLPKEKKKADEI